MLVITYDVQQTVLGTGLVCRTMIGPNVDALINEPWTVLIERTFCSHADGLIKGRTDGLIKGRTDALSLLRKLIYRMERKGN